MQGVAQLPWDGDLTRTLRVLVLAVTAARTGQLPAVALKRANDLGNLHMDPYTAQTGRRARCCSTMRASATIVKEREHNA